MTWKAPTGLALPCANLGPSLLSEVERQVALGRPPVIAVAWLVVANKRRLRIDDARGGALRYYRGLCKCKAEPPSWALDYARGLLVDSAAGGGRGPQRIGECTHAA